MSARLIDFCKWTSEKTAAMMSEVSFPGRKISDSLQASFKMLNGRLRHPEVRILILGPLKSGKSTLMNVLCQHASVSQVNPLPAYPCTVEVRDIERNNQLIPAEKECCTFYRNGIPLEPMALEAGLQHLNELLEDYIERPGKPETRYDKVVQKINLLPSPEMPPENRYTVLIDSPGLFFSNHTYSADANKEFEEADVVIFVVRQEQLFFESVNEYLKKFSAEAMHRRGFILVNIAVPTDKELESYDHNEYKKKLDTYFRRHIASPDLNQELINDDRISIRFANLFMAAAAILDKNPVYEKAYQDSETRQSLDSIRKYLRTKLVDEKIKDLSKKFEQTLREARAYLDTLLQEEEILVSEMRQKLLYLKKEIQGKEDLKCGIGDEKSVAHAAIERNTRRLEILAGDINPETLPLHDPDPLIKQLQIGFNSLPLSSAHAMNDEELRDLVTKSYMKWQGGAHGNRTFRNLVKIIWQEDVSGDNFSLVQYYHQLFFATYKDCVAKLRKSFSDELLRLAAGDSESEDIINNAINHELAKGEPKLLLFTPRGFWLWRKTPESIWGDGTRIVDEENEDILHLEADRFIGQILQDWEILDLFSSENLQRVAKDILRKNFLSHLRVLIQKQSDAQNELVGKLVKREEKVQAEIDALSETHRKQEDEWNYHRSIFSGIEDRKKHLTDMLESFQKDVYNFVRL
ncbi:hypothetical protein Ctha_0724 [Chloroherpeton thalassium ATCC 35110]|uniref:Dynamin N-terminal domain-containing protein n=1 Tax=Chloroherpeton thalassium (strain ATCC 35110 / GB-78) TaxID=517418 RepID=B3QW80_CHLT3|nr:dynamin family protein [Chloroherpeton thalassium]ACF13193.1 hypothetical protein Ctha_0724 [Chloroherpeton thalassium ATCC 35110]